jgi:hypothetical protein
MSKGTRSTDAEMRARALSRWEGEGGALVQAGAAGAIDEPEMSSAMDERLRFQPGSPAASGWYGTDTMR